jgi:hypothetical protein
MLISLSEAVRRLKCGKAKLYRILAELEIQPTLKGTSKLISEEDFLRIKEAFEVDGPYPSSETPYQTPTATTAQQSPRQRNNSGTTAENAVVEGLQAQIDLLKGQVTQLSGLLENEQSERKAERSERETYQQLLGALQQNNQKLLQENNRLQLEMLDSPARKDVHFEPRKEEDSSPVTPEAFEVEETLPVKVTNRSSSRFFGVGLSVAVIVAVLFYAAITNGGEWLSATLEQKVSAVLKVNRTEPDIN